MNDVPQDHARIPKQRQEQLSRSFTKFGSLEIGRAFAAIIVVMHHTGHIMQEPRFWGTEPASNHFDNFNVGVDFFFVLSGFIITWIHWGDLGDTSSLQRYLRKRFLRIYPPYWGVLIPLTLLYLVSPRSGEPNQHDLVNIILSFLLAPNPIHPVLGVAWTLTFEVFFYALFALIIVAGRGALWTLALWSAVILMAHGHALSFPLSFLCSPYNLEFMLGVGSAALLRYKRVPFPGLLVAAGALTFVVLLMFAPHIQDDPLAGRLAFGVPSALFVLGTVELELRRPIRIGRLLTTLGASSFSIYLIHPVALSFAARAFFHLGGRQLSANTAALPLATAVIAVGVIYHRVAEARLIQIADRLLPPIRRSADTTTIDRVT